MNARNTSLIIAYGVACALTLWYFFTLGQKPPDGSGGSASPTASDGKLTALPARDPNAAVERMAEAAVESFDPRGGADFDAVQNLIHLAAQQPVLKVDPEALALATELAADEFPAAAETTAALPDPGRAQLLKLVIARWAEFEPREAAEFATKNFDEREMSGALSVVFQSWGASDPQAALNWYGELAASGRFEPRVGLPRAVSHLFFAWAMNDAQTAAAAAQEIASDSGDFYAWVGIAGLAAYDEHRPQLLEIASAVEDEAVRTKALSQVVGQWSWSDPQGAAAWLDENARTDQKLEWAVAQRFERVDPRANANWLFQRSTDETREKALARALSSWSRSDIDAAAKWLEEVGPTEGSIPIIAQGYSSIDMTKAMTWAKRASEEKRDDVIIGTLAEARMRDDDVDVTPYLGEGSLSAEEMKKKIDERYQLLQSRF